MWKYPEKATITKKILAKTPKEGEEQIRTTQMLHKQKKHGNRRTALERSVWKLLGKRIGGGGGGGEGILYLI